MCPIPFDPLSFPTLLAYNYADFNGPYFNRSDVKKALHVPEDISWSECISQNVFVNGEDNSLDPIQHVLPKVVEKTNRVLVANGDYDFEIISDGTLLAIQNMTWNGALGFQSKPQTEIVIDLPDLMWQNVLIANGLGGLDGPGQGVMGVQHYERGTSLSQSCTNQILTNSTGLMFATTHMSGHMQPQFQPRVSYRHLQWVLGRIETL
jgi:carboxypeptidase D